LNAGKTVLSQVQNGFASFTSRENSFVPNRGPGPLNSTAGQVTGHKGLALIIEWHTSRTDFHPLPCHSAGDESYNHTMCVGKILIDLIAILNILIAVISNIEQGQYPPAAVQGNEEVWYQ